MQSEPAEDAKYKGAKAVVIEQAQALWTDEGTLCKLLRKMHPTDEHASRTAAQMYQEAIRERPPPSPEQEEQPWQGTENTITYVDFERMMYKIKFWPNPVPIPDACGNFDFGDLVD